MRLWHMFLDILLPQRTTHASIRNKTIEDAGVFLSPILLPTNFGDVTALLPYREPLIRSLVVEAKFHKTSEAIRILGRVLAEYLSGFAEESAFETRRYVLIPIPLSKQRFRERGYNQVAQIARSALVYLAPNFTVDTTLLTRARDTKAQTTLTRSARLGNMTGAFLVTREPSDEVTYILIDDVMTTGTTLSVACAALQQKNYQPLTIVVLAH